MGDLMATLELTKDNIDQTIEGNDVVLIHFSAPWNEPCKAFQAIFESASERYPDMVFAVCNTEEQREITEMFKVEQLPTLVVFRQRAVVFGQHGAITAAHLDDLLTRVAHLDMEAIHDAIAKQEADAESDQRGEVEG
jgi:thioredoxin 1